MDYTKRQELIAKLDEADKLIREGISSYDTVVAEREHLTKARGQLQECMTEILCLK